VAEVKGTQDETHSSLAAIQTSLDRLSSNMTDLGLHMEEAGSKHVLRGSVEGAGEAELRVHGL
jgi:hypothetical protein